MQRWILMVVSGLLLCAGSAWGLNEEHYHIGRNDVIKISVYDHQDLETTSRVSAEGSLQFPLIGQVSVAGLTVSEVADKISRLLADGYIINPQVSVFIEEFRSSKVVVVGQVNSPGLYELSGPTSLLELISKAGGLTPDAGDMASIQRQQVAIADEEKTLHVNLKRLLEDGERALDVLLKDGDNVFVTRAGMVYVTGEVSRPDSYKVEEDTTVIMAITLAGGFTKLASKGKVKLLRKEDGTEQVYEHVPMNMPVLPDDVLVVPESFF